MQKVFDYIIITVSNKYQEKILNEKIESRKKENIIPLETKYLIIEENEKIGSGGAVLNIIKMFSKDEKFFAKNKVLLINSAGDSKRLILYADKGKVCTPTFRQITKNITSTVFDEIMVETKTIGEKMNPGMLVVSGDCTTLYKNFPSRKIENNTAISVRANVELGERHGVFIEEKGKLKETLQKNTIQELKNKNAVDKENSVNIDTGMIYFNLDTINVLQEIVMDEIEFKNIVNKNVRLNLYTDFIYPLSKDANKEIYLRQKAEIDINDQIINAKEKIWNALNKKDIDILKVIDGEFIHFGTVKEFIGQAFNKYKTDNIILNSVVSKDAKLKGKNYIENSILKGKCNIGKNSIIIDSVISDCDIPNDVIIKTIKNKQDYITIIFTLNDNPKELWEHKIYSKCNTQQEAVKTALELYKNAKEHNYNDCCNSEKLSIKEIFEAV